MEGGREVMAAREGLGLVRIRKDIWCKREEDW